MTTEKRNGLVPGMRDAAKNALKPVPKRPKSESRGIGAAQATQGTTRPSSKGRMVKLQINSSGAWKDLLRFDIDTVDDQAIQVAAAHLVNLADPDGRTGLRIAIADGYQTVLVRWDQKKGWVDAQ
jgi:hypothetical protein